MPFVNIGNGIYIGLSTDNKSLITNEIANAIFIERDTGRITNGSNNSLTSQGAGTVEVYLEDVWRARNTKTGSIISSNSSLTTVLQAAINSLTGGRTVKESVKVKGSGSISTSITIPSYTVLDMSEAKISLANATATPMFINSDTTNGNTQIEIRGGIIDGNKTNQAATPADEDTRNIVQFTKVTDSSVSKMYIDESSSRAIRFRECVNCTAEFNTVLDTGAEGIQTRLGSNNKILYNTVKNTGYSFITSYETPDTIVTGNYCDTNVTGSPSGINISSLRNKVINNTIKGSVAACLYLSEVGSTYDSSGVEIIGNTISGSTANGGIIAAGQPLDGAIIKGNFVYSNFTAGIRFSGAHKNIIIEDNIVHDNNDSGIHVSGTVATSIILTQFSIHDNICYNNGKGVGADTNRCGIVLNGTDAGGVIEGMVKNNICYDNQGGQTQKYGIRAINTDQVSVIGNKVRGNLTDGIILTTNTNFIHYNNPGYSVDNLFVGTQQANTYGNFEQLITAAQLKLASNGFKGTFGVQTNLTADRTWNMPNVSANIVGTGTTDTLANKTFSGFTMTDATNIVLNATTGTKIGTATSQKLGFYNATPVVQGSSIIDITNTATGTEIATAVNALISRLESLGLIATV